MVDRSKRYDKPVHPDKQGKRVNKEESVAEEVAKKSAGDPPSAEHEDGAVKRPDDGPEPGHGPAFGVVADRHKREMSDMHKRHETEMGDVHERHKKEHSDMMRRHGREVEKGFEEGWKSEDVGEPESGGAPKEVKSGEGPKLGESKEESKTGGAMKKDSSPKLGKTEDKGDKGTEP